MAGALLLGWLVPETAPMLAAEDDVIETATALSFAAAAVWSTAAILRRPRARWSCAPLPLLALLAALDEVSWGERIFGLQRPSVGGERIDGVHDLFEIGLRALLAHTAVPAVLALVLLLGAGLLWVVLRRSRLLQRIRQLCAHWPAYGFLLGAAVPILLAQVLDYTPLEDRLGTPGLLAQESLEYAGAIAMVFGAFAIAHGEPSASAGGCTRR